MDREPPPRLRPLYVVAFDAGSATAPDHDRPTGTPAAVPEDAVRTGTVPHGLDADLVEALPALWYCLQLPRTRFDLTDWPDAGALLLANRFGVGHHVVLTPVDAFDMSAQRRHSVPALVLCPDRSVDALGPAVSDAGFSAGPVGFSRLSDSSLRAHWRLVADALGVPVPDDAPTSLVRRLDLAGVSLPRRQLRRALGRSGGEVDGPDLLNEAMWDLLTMRANLRALAERGPGDPGDAVPSGDEVVARLKEGRFPVTLVAPGLAPRYARRAHDPAVLAALPVYAPFDEAAVWSADAPTGDGAAERSAMMVAATHSALARAGIALPLAQVPDEAWTVLGQLEQHLRETDGAKPRKVTKLLGRLSDICRPLWTDDVVDALQGASSVQVVSNFPLGLLTPPGGDSPLAARVPVVQRPVTPLTRRLQQDLSGIPAIDMTGGLRVLVAECVPTGDPVGVLSRGGWDVVGQELVRSGSRVELSRADTPTPPDLRDAVEAHRPGLLVVSAHGWYDEAGGLAGLHLGQGRPVLGPELGRMPPVVVLSACSTAPRGHGGPTVTDQLLRQGAVAVLGAQVPVDVRRNSVLLGRLLAYIHLVLDGEEPHDTLLDVWHRVQATNVVNDVVSSSSRLAAWATSASAYRPAPLASFMSASAEPPLRADHVYTDTIARLERVADDRGDGEQVRRWLRRGYVPETAFYHFVGEPERVLFRSPS